MRCQILPTLLREIASKFIQTLSRCKSMIFAINHGCRGSIFRFLDNNLSMKNIRNALSLRRINPNNQTASFEMILLFWEGFGKFRKVAGMHQKHLEGFRIVWGCFG